MGWDAHFTFKQMLKQADGGLEGRRLGVECGECQAQAPCQSLRLLLPPSFWSLLRAQVSK